MGPLPEVNEMNSGRDHFYAPEFFRRRPRLQIDTNFSTHGYSETNTDASLGKESFC